MSGLNVYDDRDQGLRAGLRLLRQGVRPRVRADQHEIRQGVHRLSRAPEARPRSPHQARLGRSFYKFIISKSDAYWQLEWRNGLSAWNDDSIDVKLEVADKKGFGAAKLDGVLYIVVYKSDRKMSQGYFATSANGGEVYHVAHNDTTNAFDTLASKVT